MGFSTIEEVAAWAEHNGGEKGLSEASAQGRFGNELRSINLINMWFAQQEAARQEERIRVERELRNREVIAAETSATAARESADAAKVSADAARKSAHWAIWAAIIALLAVVVAVFK